MSMRKREKEKKAKNFDYKNKNLITRSYPGHALRPARRGSFKKP
jgi:hypothetical protein